MSTVGIIAPEPKGHTGDEATQKRRFEVLLRKAVGDPGLRFEYAFFDAADPHLRDHGHVDRVYNELAQRGADVVVTLDSRVAHRVPDRYNRHDGLPMPIVAVGGTRWEKGTNERQVTGFLMPTYFLEVQMKTIFSKVGDGEIVLIYVEDNNWEDKKAATQTAALAAGVNFDLAKAVRVQDPRGFEAAFLDAAQKDPRLIHLVPHEMFSAYPAYLASLEGKVDVPTCYPSAASVAAGGFMSVSLDPADFTDPNGLGYFVREVLAGKPPSEVRRRYRRITVKVNENRVAEYRAAGRPLP